MSWTHHHPDPATSGKLINLLCFCLLAWNTSRGRDNLRGQGR